MKKEIEIRKSANLIEFKILFKNEIKLFFNSLGTPIEIKKNKNKIKNVIEKHFEKMYYNIYALYSITNNDNYFTKSFMTFEFINYPNTKENLIKISFKGDKNKHYQNVRIDENFNFIYDSYPSLEIKSKEEHLVYWGGALVNKKLNLPDENISYEKSNSTTTFTRTKNGIKTKEEYYKDGSQITILNPSFVGQKILETYRYDTDINNNKITTKTFCHKIIHSENKDLFVSIEDSNMKFFNRIYFLKNGRPDILLNFCLHEEGRDFKHTFFDTRLIKLSFLGDILEVVGQNVSSLNLNIENFQSEGVDLLSMIKDINLDVKEKKKIELAFKLYKDILGVSNNNFDNKPINYNKETFYPFIKSYISGIKKIEKALKTSRNLV